MRPANFIAGQQKYFGGKTIFTCRKAAPAGALLVRNFHLFDSRSNFGINQVIEVIVQIGMGGATSIVVGVCSMPLAVFVDVLHQHPCTVAACVIDARIRDALMHDDEIFGRTVDFDFDDAANGLCA